MTTPPLRRKRDLVCGELRSTGAGFHYRGADVPYLRLAFGHLTEDRIKAGIPILARCIREARTSNEPVGFDSLF